MGELFRREQPHHGYGAENIKQGRYGDAEDRRAGNSPFRIDDVAGRNRRRFQSEIGKHGQGCEDGARFKEGFAAWIEALEVGAIDKEETNQRDRCERYEFGIGGEFGE